jgi:PIN domain nuclease of toxin-antitoxin system
VSLLLVDTHVFLWAAGNPSKLSERARAALVDASNELYLSAASVFEIAVKAAKGHLLLPDEAGRFLATRLPMLGMRELPITGAHATAAAALPPIHSDPWDRMLVAQAQLGGLAILTSDRLVQRYDVETIW